MALQLTPDQERRIQAIVNAGAYPTVEEALDAAVSAVEIAAGSGFEGTQEELEELMVEGLNSGAGVEINDAYWSRLRAETDGIARSHLGRNPNR
jgi:hypothetical protein